MLKEIDADYYGYLDDDDNLLVPQEEKCEKEARKLKVEEYKAKLEELTKSGTIEMNMETNNDLNGEVS